MSDYGLGSEFDIGFPDHFNIPLLITLNYSVIAALHNLQITRAHTLDISW
jgi:hypothetical protein